MKLFIGIVIFVFVFWIATPLVVYLIFPDWEISGQFGDVFGSINALFSGLAFAGLIYAILLQKNELSLQREELQLQREEMKKSREALAEQAKLQGNQLLATITELNIRVLEAEISALEMESLSEAEHAKGSRYGPKIRDTVERMQKTIKVLTDDIQDHLNKPLL